MKCEQCDDHYGPLRPYRLYYPNSWVEHETLCENCSVQQHLEPHLFHDRFRYSIVNTVRVPFTSQLADSYVIQSVMSFDQMISMSCEFLRQHHYTQTHTTIFRIPSSSSLLDPLELLESTDVLQKEACIIRIQWISGFGSQPLLRDKVRYRLFITLQLYLEGVFHIVVSHDSYRQFRWNSMLEHAYLSRLRPDRPLDLFDEECLVVRYCRIREWPPQIIFLVLECLSMRCYYVNRPTELFQPASIHPMEQFEDNVTRMKRGIKIDDSMVISYKNSKKRKRSSLFFLVLD
jgi:hypothetical protein